MKKKIEEVAPELLEASGSREQYHKDMHSFVERAKKEIDQLQQTKAGREKLKKAGLARPGTVVPGSMKRKRKH